MTAILDTAPDTARLTAASTLQQLVPELVALTIDAKQAPWNVTGPAFLPLHFLSDEIAADTRSWTDRSAERVSALGYAVDARPGIVAGVAGGFPAGHLNGRAVIRELIQSIDRAATTARRSLSELEQTDVVAHDIAVEILEGLEKYR